MTLNSTAKAIIGVLTALVALFPLVLIALWFTMFITMMGSAPRDYPFERFDAVFSWFFSAMCLLSLLMYVMTAFYVTHAIKNSAGSDVIRIIGLLLVFFFPYLGMPAYYVIYILMSKPPSWAMKPTSLPSSVTPDPPAA